MVGGAIGTVVTWSVAGYLVESVGWDYAFYVPAILSGCFTIIWFITTFDEPSSHPRISMEEKEYIENSLLGVTYTKVNWSLPSRKHISETQSIEFIFVALAATMACS